MNQISGAILFLICILIIHLIEEVKTEFRKRLPLGEMSATLFVGINIVIYLFCFSTLYLSMCSHPLTIPFTWMFALGMLLNGIGHIVIMLVKKAYFPGGITAPVLMGISIYLIHLLLI